MCHLGHARAWTLWCQGGQSSCQHTPAGSLVDTPTPFFTCAWEAALGAPYSGGIGHSLILPRVLLQTQDEARELYWVENSPGK